MQFFTFLFIPLFPLGFYVVKNGGGSSYFFIGKVGYADLKGFAGPEGMRALWLSLLRQPSVLFGLGLIALCAVALAAGG